MSKGFKDLLQKVYECDRKTVAVAVAEDEPVLEAVKAAKEKGIADAILVGDEAKIKEIAAVAVFLASDASSIITGAYIAADMGTTCN